MRKKPTELTPQHRKIISGIARGGTNKQLMMETGWSRATINRCLGEIRALLNVQDRVQIAVCAMQRGLVDPRTAWERRFVAPCLGHRGDRHGSGSVPADGRHDGAQEV
jgi:DNA-binding CsgD family transcriptional regulator